MQHQFNSRSPSRPRSISPMKGATRATSPPSPKRKDTHHRDRGSFGFRNKFFRFVGDTVNGAPTGYGVIFLADGGVVEGEFDGDGEMTCDNGCRRWSDGSVYMGPFLKGEAHGKGRQLNAFGDEYDGEFQSGLRHGQGLCKNRATRTAYHGAWEKNKYHGEGILRVEGQLECKGHFVGGVPHGICQIRYANGDSYDGELSEGFPDGIGSFFSAATDIVYYGPMTLRRRGEIANYAFVSDILIRGRAVVAAGAFGTTQRARARKTTPSGAIAEPPRYVDQLSDNDHFFTNPLNAPFEVKIQLAEEQVQRKINLSEKILKRTPTMTKKPALEMKLASQKRIQTSESGRRVVCTAYAVPDGGSVERVGELVDAGQQVPLADRNVKPQDITRALAGTRATQKRPKIGVGKLPPLNFKGIELPPCATEICATTVNGEAAFYINLVTVDPGDYVLKFVVQSHLGVQMEPGNSASIEPFVPLVAYLPLHVVRQC